MGGLLATTSARYTIQTEKMHSDCMKGYVSPQRGQFKGAGSQGHRWGTNCQLEEVQHTQREGF